ncbi:hypothetical protein FNV43_RR14477 [Rhamnella rubrinervis]|uniref:Uncharacterized protein n=1 Tax=Rhamnella rubrinervis TaxID=2594499 RepID=A0A8K0MFR5_9ROSA|nr:hypothetical protein FNV43_RR14477 [Rhamnella rubrinervis]
MEIQSFGVTEPFKSLPKCSFSAFVPENIAPRDDVLRSSKKEDFRVNEDRKSVFESICQDDKTQLVSSLKGLFKTYSEPVDRGIVSKFLHLCCVFDSVECASALLCGELSTVPLVNHINEMGKTALHTAAESHSSRCVGLLLKKRARTDLRTKDGRAQLALELSLSSTRMDVIWSPDAYSIQDLIVFLREKDLTSVRLLTENTKEAAEVACAKAVEGRIVALGALLLVAPEKVNEWSIHICDTDSGSMAKMSICECVVREALSLGHEKTPSKRAKNYCSTESEKAKKRKLMLCEIELLLLFGAAAQTSCTDKKVTSLLIRAVQAGDEAVTELLLKTNRDINDVDVDGNSALHWSLKAFRGSCLQDIKFLWLLLKHGAKVSQRNKLGLTALHVAASNGNLQALQILLLEDPDGINYKTEMKETPLFYAVKNDHMDCAELLLCWGANTEVLNLRRQRPIDLAVSQDMRFMLNPANHSLVSRKSIQRKNTACLQGNEVFDAREALLTMTDEVTTLKRISPSLKSEICKYFTSPSGCVRGDKCFFEHGEEEHRQMKQGTYLNHSHAANKFKRKIFVGGIPPSVDSDEKSASAAVQAHYFSIMDRHVEIKSIVPKCFLMADRLQKPSPRLHEPEKNHQCQPPPSPPTPEEKNMEQTKPDESSWVDKLLSEQPKTYSNESQIHKSTGSEEQSMPKWLRIFKKWFPSFLEEMSNHPREGEYALSSLKGDFRTKFGLELDHASLGYSKLSDFIKCSDLCCIKVVPIGRNAGFANHMVLSAKPRKPHQQRVHKLRIPNTSPRAPSIDDGNGGNSNDSKCLQDLSSGYSGGVSNEEENPFSGYSKVNSSQADKLPYLHYRLLNFSKQDPSFNEKCEVGMGDNDNVGGDVKEVNWNDNRHRQPHLVLEALLRKRKNSSVYFLREFDFYNDYKKSITVGKCFGCKQGNMLWANFPCKHSLWCTDCKVYAKRAAGAFAHLCVVCDVEVQKIDLVLCPEYFRPIGD